MLGAIKRVGQRKGGGKGASLEDDQCLKIGDLVVLSSVEEDERAYLTSVTVPGEDPVVVVQSGTKKKNSVFEIHPMIHNAGKKALQKAQKGNSSNLATLQENAKKETEQNEAVSGMMEGTPVRFGQIIQLTHTESGHQFLAGSTSEAAHLEQSCGKIFLRKNTGKKCWFKFLAVEEKAEGGKIPLGASVILQQAGNFDLYVHRSSWTDEQGDFEANISINPTVWTVELFDSGKRNLKSGAMIRLQHQKAGYMISTSIREKVSSDSKETVLFRCVPPAQKDQPEESTNSIWVVEGTSTAISFQTEVRFNLWGSDKYLAMTENQLSGQISSLLSSKKDSSTLFKFGKSDQKDTSNSVTLNSYVNIQHVKTGRWIKGVPLIDQSAHWAVECSPKLSQSEIIRLIPVSQSQVILINYLNHLRPDLERYVEKLRIKRPLEKIGFMEEIIVDLIQWIMDPPPPKENPMITVGKPIKDRQFLLGNSAMLDLLVELVVLPFVEGYYTYDILEKSPEFRYQCELVYWLLAKVTYRLPKVANRLFKYMNEFSKQMKARLPIFPLLEEIFRDNKDLGQNLDPAQLEDFILLMTSSGIRSSDFLDFLVKLCVCEGQAIVNNQDIICRSLLHSHPNYLLLTKFEQKKMLFKKAEILISEDGGENWMRVDEFLWTADRSLVKFHASTLMLFHALCFGRNSTCIATVENFVGVEETIQAIMTPNLPFSLRTAYCSVLEAVYLDRHPNKPLTIATIYPIRNEEEPGPEDHSDSCEKEEEEEDEEEESIYFGEAEEFRKTFEVIDQEREMQIEESHEKENEERRIRRRTLRGNIVWKNFVDYFDSVLSGLKHPSSAMNSFFLSLLKLLKTILLFQLSSIDANTKLLKSLTTVLHYYLDESWSRPPEFEVMLEVKFEVCAIFEIYFLHSLKVRFEALINKCSKKGANIKRIVDGQIRSVRKTLLSDIRHDKQREKVLMDILFHRSAELSAVAMALLVSDASTQVPAYENIARKMKFLKSKEEVGLHDVVLNQCIPTLNEASDSLQDCDFREVMEKIKKLLEMCSDHNKPNVANQNLLAHLGVQRAIMIFLESMPRNIKSELEATGHQKVNISIIDHRTLYSMSYLFLQNFCRASPSNQALLYQTMDLFVSHFSLGILAEETVTTILVDNVALCRKLSPHYILLVINQIRQSPQTSLKLLRLLQVVAMPGGKSNRPIQNLILKQIVAHSAELCPYLTPEESHHLVVCSESEEPEDQMLLSYYVQLVHVLSACSYGKSHTAEAMCQRLLPLKVILNTLEETRNVELQSAFTRFLDEVWFYTEIVEPQLMFIQSNPQLWKILQIFYNQMMSYCNFLKDLTRPSHNDSGVTTARLRQNTTLGDALKQEDDFQFQITKFNIGGWTIYLCDQREQIDVTIELFDAATAMIQTKLRHKERIHKIQSFLEALIEEELIDRQRVDRARAAIRTKQASLEKKVAHEPPGYESIGVESRESEFDAHSIVEFRLATQDVPVVFPRLARHLKNRQDKFRYAELLTEIVKDGSISDMEFKLSCLRLLRYIIYRGPIEDIQDDGDKLFFSHFQLHLAKLQLVPATLALLGPAKDDVDICTQALDLAMVLTYQNKTVRDMLMDFYFTVAEEVIWMDLRSLIQRSIDHVRKQKSSRPAPDRDPRRIAPLRHATSKLIIDTLEPDAPSYHTFDLPEIGQFPQLPYTRMAFKFMQSLCADHDPKVQRYLRQQEDNYQNADLVRESVLYLRMIDDFCNLDTVDDIFQCILFMQDLAIGSRENQMDLVLDGVLESLDYLLKKKILTPFGPEYAEQEADLQVKVTELLLTLLEGNTETCIPASMITTLNFHALLYHATFQPEENSSEDVTKKKKTLAGNTYRLIKMLGEMGDANIPEEHRDILDQALSKIDSEAETSIRRIEIVAADRSLQRLYFPLPSTCLPPRVEVEELQSELVHHFALGGVNWLSTTERVEELCRWCEDKLIIFEHQRYVNDDRLIGVRHILIRIALFYALILNILVVTFADTDKKFRHDMFLYLRLLGIIECIFAIVITVGYFRRQAKPHYYIRWRNIYNRVYEKSTEMSNPPSILFSFGQRDAYIRQCLPYLYPTNMPDRAKLVLYTVYGFLSDIRIDGAVYQFLYILAVLLGISIHPFFYCFLLLDVVRISQSLQTVLRTIYFIALTLIFIGILIVIIIWIGSLYVFIFIKESMDPTIGQYCDYPLQCGISLSHIGISFAGAPMEFITLSAWDDTGTYMGTVIFNIIFYIAVGMILFNIIFAVIVDKFGDLRDTRANILSDFLNRCFICSIEREVFQRLTAERAGLHSAGKKVFVDHINNDHRPWDYLFFFEYLKYKSDPMTSSEEHVRKMIERSRWLSFMPIGRAKILESDLDEHTVSLEERIEILSKAVLVLTRLVARLQTKLNYLLSKQTGPDVTHVEHDSLLEPIDVTPSHFESFDDVTHHHLYGHDPLNVGELPEEEAFLKEGEEEGESGDERTKGVLGGEEEL